MVERLILVHSDRGRAVDGIRDYSLRLVEEIPRHSVQSQLWPGAAGPLRPWREIEHGGRTTAIVLQYSPFCFARWGFAPWLPARLLALRTRRDRPALALMIHEPYVPIDSWRNAAMGGWQRFQLAALRLAADVVFTSIDSWAEGFRGRRPVRDVRHLPVGSNLPDERAQRDRGREAMGIAEGTLVVAAMGRKHPSWLAEYVIAAANRIAAAGRRVVFLALGAEAPRLDGLDPAIEVQAPGYLEAERLAAKLATADLFLAPLIDGVSTRRGTLMAAIQHGLPVVGTAGPLTDRVLLESEAALRLTPVGDPAGFAQAAVDLAESPGARESAGVAARQLYERNFDWPVIAEQLLVALPDR